MILQFRNRRAIFNRSRWDDPEYLRIYRRCKPHPNPLVGSSASAKIFYDFSFLLRTWFENFQSSIERIKEYLDKNTQECTRQQFLMRMASAFDPAHLIFFHELGKARDCARNVRWQAEHARQEMERLVPAMAEELRYLTTMRRRFGRSDTEVNMVLCNLNLLRWHYDSVRYTRYQAYRYEQGLLELTREFPELQIVSDPDASDASVLYF